MADSEKPSIDQSAQDEARLRALSTSLRFVEAVRSECPRLSRRLRSGRAGECGAELHALVEGLRALAELFVELDGELGGRGSRDRGTLARLLRDVVQGARRGDWLAVAAQLDETLLPAAPRWQHALAARLEVTTRTRAPEPAADASPAGESD